MVHEFRRQSAKLPLKWPDTFPCGAGRFAEQTAVVAAVDAQPFGDGEDRLPVGDGRADCVRDCVGRQERAFLVDTRTTPCRVVCVG